MRSCSNNTESVIEMLEITATKLFQWFKDNNLKANADKCHLLLITNESEQININDTIIDSSNAEKLLGVLIDNKLNFDKHVSSRSETTRTFTDIFFYEYRISSIKRPPSNKRPPRISAPPKNRFYE